MAFSIGIWMVNEHELNSGRGSGYGEKDRLKPYRESRIRLSGMLMTQEVCRIVPYVWLVVDSFNIKLK